MKGTYILIIKNRKSRKIKIGKLGEFTFPGGYYAYVGSAFGKTVNLGNRVIRHVSNKKKTFWHIDYFLKAKGVKITGVKTIPGRRIECETAQKLLKTGRAVVKKFGSSDCRCKSHLVYFGRKSSPHLPSWGADS
jgi:endonuclease-3